MAANCCQRSTAELPTTGIFSSQPGGGGILTVDNDLNHPTISSVWSRMVRTAKQIGTIKTSSNRTVITRMASQRLPQSRVCSLRKYGQVAMTIMAAHSSDERNGRMTQKHAAIRMPMNSTASVVRVRSDELVWVMVFMVVWFFGSVHFYEIRENPRPIEMFFGRGVEVEAGKPCLAGHAGNPVLLEASRDFRADVNVQRRHRPVGLIHLLPKGNEGSLVIGVQLISPVVWFQLGISVVNLAKADHSRQAGRLNLWRQGAFGHSPRSGSHPLLLYRPASSRVVGCGNEFRTWVRFSGPSVDAVSPGVCPSACPATSWPRNKLPTRQTTPPITPQPLHQRHCPRLQLIDNSASYSPFRRSPFPLCLQQSKLYVESRSPPARRPSPPFSHAKSHEGARRHGVRYDQRSRQEFSGNGARPLVCTTRPQGCALQGAKHEQQCAGRGRRRNGQRPVSSSARRPSSAGCTHESDSCSNPRATPHRR